MSLVDLPDPDRGKRGEGNCLDMRFRCFPGFINDRLGVVGVAYSLCFGGTVYGRGEVS